MGRDESGTTLESPDCESKRHAAADKNLPRRLPGRPQGGNRALGFSRVTGTSAKLQFRTV
jgi:hypothetical protein